jgi:membrane-associated phospholipid phosphatase
LLPVVVAGVLAGSPCPATATAAASGDRYELRSGREIALFAAGGALLGFGRVVQARQDTLGDLEIASRDPSGRPAFDRLATTRWSPAAAAVSDGLVAGLLAAPLLLAATDPGADEAGTLLTMYGETLLLEAGVVACLKGLVNRPRPFVDNADPAVPAARRRSAYAMRSFPSGHAANAFAAAVFAGTVHARFHPDDRGRAWVWAGGLGLAGTVSYLRVRSGHHFPTDVLAGALIGAAAGYLVPRLHEHGGDPAERAAPGWRVGWAVNF